VLFSRLNSWLLIKKVEKVSQYTKKISLPKSNDHAAADVDDNTGNIG